MSGRVKGKIGAKGIQVPDSWQAYRLCSVQVTSRLWAQVSYEELRLKLEGI